MPGNTLEGQKAIVTGASSGIGSAIVRRFHSEGCAVWAAGGRNEEGLRQTLEACTGGAKTGGRCYDLTDARRASEVIRDGVEFLGGLDILVNCAAMRSHKDFVDFEEADIDALFEVNAKAVFIASRDAARVMAPQGSGRILMIGSIDGERGVKGNALYCATKVSMHSLARALAVELGPLGIRTNCLLPGTTESERVKKIHIDRPDYAASKLPKIPARRFASPEEMAAVATFLVSPENDFMNGASVISDGGVLAM